MGTAEFDLVELDEGHTRASVIMPQKKNPYALNYVRGATNELTGTLANAVALGRTPSGQVDNRVFLYGDVPRALETAPGVANLMAGVLTGLHFNAPVAESRLANGFAMATDLAETITLETGLDFRSAHRIVGRLVRDAAQTNRLMRDLTVADLDAAALVILNRPLRLPEAVFAQVLDPTKAAVAARQGIGGAAAEPLAAMLAECSAGLDACTTWQKKASTSAESAEEALLCYTRSFVEVYHARPSH